VVLGAGNKQINRTESQECSGLHGKKTEDEEAGRLGNSGGSCPAGSRTDEGTRSTKSFASKADKTICRLKITKFMAFSPLPAPHSHTRSNVCVCA